MQKYQTFIPRFLALILDSILLLPLFVIDQMAADSSFSPTVKLGVNIATSLFGVLYVILMLYFFGQTVGKMLMKVKVLDVSEKPLRFIQSVLRNFPQLISVIVFLIFGDPEYFLQSETEKVEFSKNLIGNSFYILLMIWGVADIVVFLMNDKKRALHDYVAGSVVVRLGSDEQDS